MILDGFRAFNRLAAAEGIVLLKNDNNVLPIKNEKVAIFGRCQIDYYKSGKGSGGAVNSKYVVNILEGFRNNDNIFVDEDIARLYEGLTKSTPDASENKMPPIEDYELEISEDIIMKASKNNNKAVIVIGRATGEGCDTENIPGGYMLTLNEVALVTKVRKYFDKFVVLLNCGNLIDMNWVENLDVPAVMYIWQGGEEGGNAVADVVSGIVPPSGRLTDTIVKDYTMYPSSRYFNEEDEIVYSDDIFVGYRFFETFEKDAVMYPFGYGIGYTEFEIVCNGITKDNRMIELLFDVRNIGDFEGREVVQVYIEGVCEKLSRPSRELVAFVKTKNIKPNQSERVSITFDILKTASYDDEGITGNKSTWIIEAGNYNIYAGKNVREAKKVYSYEITDTIVVEKLTSCMVPDKEFERITNNYGQVEYKKVSICTELIDERVEKELPEKINSTFKGDFKQAVENNNIRGFVGAMSNKELMTIARGEGMLNPKVTHGVASCFGGVSDALENKGIPLASTADGPSGIRMDNGEYASSMPNGTLLACSWDVEMVQKLYEYVGKELCLNGIDMLLGPGMNIHINPLCGRNFEYFSEDPLLSGMVCAAAIKGLYSGGSHGVIKHFACNNREYRRNFVNSVVSERALREIYLKGFEIAIKTSPVIAVMTSYNLINGYYSASNYELTTTILRNEWKYKGMVMSDWWAYMNYAPGDDCSREKLSAMIKAQNDIYMVVHNFQAENWKDDLVDRLKKRILFRSELQRNAINILNVLPQLLCYERRYGYRIKNKNEVDFWFKTRKTNREYNLIKCLVPHDIHEKKVFVYMEKVVANEGVQYCYKAIGKREDDMCIDMWFNAENTEAEFRLLVNTNATELEQFAAFLKIDKEEYPISFVGTNNRDSWISVKVKSKEESKKAILSFAKSNPTAVNLKAIQLITLNKRNLK